MNKKDITRSCIDCAVAACESNDAKYPPFCTSDQLDDALINESFDLYTKNKQNAEVSQKSALVEYENYCKMTRIEEIAEFAHKMNFKKLGIATCVGLLSEARAAAAVFRKHGFEVIGAGCKIGSIKKTAIGIEPQCEEVGVNMCNPILQAKFLNSENTDLNIVIGLCVGHDSLFYKYSDALCTTLVTKDRVLGHNPVAALYQINTYYSKLLDEDKPDNTQVHDKTK